MRYELSDHEWAAINPMLPHKLRGIPRVNDRRVLNGIFWVLRSSAPWRDLPQEFGPYITCYNRFVRWRRAGVWGRIMDTLAAAHDAAVQMIDTSMPTGSERLSAIMEPGRISLQSAIGRRCSASARISTGLEIWSSGSSTRSSIVVEWQPAKTSSRPTTSRSSNLRRSGYGCALMSPRPSWRSCGLAACRRKSPVFPCSRRSRR